MKKAFQQVPKSLIAVPDSLLIFAFFSCGALAAAFGLFLLPELLPPRQFLALLMLALLLFSLSVLGWLLIPLCSFFLGVFLEQAALNAYEAVLLPSHFPLRSILSGLVLIPAFFLASAHGLCVSSALQSLFSRGSPSVKTAFIQEVLCVTSASLLGFSSIFYYYP